MEKIVLFHGTPNKVVTPIFGGGDDKHDYGLHDLDLELAVKKVGKV